MTKILIRSQTFDEKKTGQKTVFRHSLQKVDQKKCLFFQEELRFKIRYRFQTILTKSQPFFRSAKFIAGEI